MTEAAIDDAADRPTSRRRCSPGAQSPRCDHSEGMAYLDTLPKRVVTVYIPLVLIMVVLLFPFYWMVLTAIKPDEQLLDLERFNPFFVTAPTFKHIYRAPVRDRLSALALEHDVHRGRRRPCCRCSRACFAAYAITRIRYRGAQWVGGAIFLAYLVPPSILFIPLSTVIYQYGLFDTPFALILTYPTILIPFSTWLLMGYFKTIPYELEECALIDGASRWQILDQDHPAARGPRPDLGLDLLPHAVLERVHLRADLHLLRRRRRPCRWRSSASSSTATSTAGAR